MKTIIASILLLAAPIANATNFDFKATLKDGSYFRGNFTGIVDDDFGDFILFDRPGFVAYYSSQGAPIESNSFDITPSDDVRSDGELKGLDMVWLYDSGGQDEDVYFIINKNGASMVFENNFDYITFGGKLARNGWQLTPSFKVPESPATLGLLSLSLIGLAGVKRGWRR